MQYKIFHGPDVVHILECKPDVAIASGQPNQETFTVESEAIERLLELNSNYFPQWNRDEAYLEGDRVMLGDSVFRALQEIDTRDFELPDDLEFNPDAEVATPRNRTARWAEVYDPNELNEEESDGGPVQRSA